MQNQELVNYIISQLGKGSAWPDVKNILLSKGWTEGVLEQAFKDASANVSPPAQNIAPAEEIKPQQMEQPAISQQEQPATGQSGSPSFEIKNTEPAVNYAQKPEQPAAPASGFSNEFFGKEIDNILATAAVKKEESPISLEPAVKENLADKYAEKIEPAVPPFVETEIKVKTVERPVEQVVARPETPAIKPRKSSSKFFGLALLIIGVLVIGGCAFAYFYYYLPNTAADNDTGLINIPTGGQEQTANPETGNTTPEGNATEEQGTEQPAEGTAGSETPAGEETAPQIDPQDMAVIQLMPLVTAGAESYKTTKGTYVGFISSASGAHDAIISINNSGGAAAAAYASKTKYCVSKELPVSKKFFCVDSAGFSGETETQTCTKTTYSCQ
ncbi:MAG: hypothetical protein PHG23_02450 [Candidatus Pacebacteria bacterium]|nr:hypothetical protein [Candidatus Paceibacterota bacterium]